MSMPRLGNAPATDLATTDKPCLILDPLDGRDAIVQVPAARWDVYAQLALPEPIASRVRHTGFVSGAELVDNAAFAVSAAEAAAMDPCQRLLLEHGYMALHDAALDRQALSSSLTGVFLGFAGFEFAQVLAGLPAGGSVYAATGVTASIAAPPSRFPGLSLAPPE